VIETRFHINDTVASPCPQACVSVAMVRQSCGVTCVAPMSQPQQLQTVVDRAVDPHVRATVDVGCRRSTGALPAVAAASIRARRDLEGSRSIDRIDQVPCATGVGSGPTVV
jgi:hypothetical protein